MWHVYPILTVTGEVGSRLDPLSGSWAIEINKAETGSVKVRKKDLVKRSREWWAPHSGGLLFTYTDPSGTERPIAGGPITGWSAETDEDLTLDWSGIRWILTGRVIAHDYAYRGLSLGTIAWRIVDESCQIKPGGLLPIVHGSPEESVGDGADHQRTYEGWNLSNNGVDKRLTELSDVLGGPDIMFRPEWVDEDHRQVQWVMVHGTEHNPSIAQDRTADFDTTAPGADITDLSMKSEASQVVCRVWATGAGEGAGVARTYVEDLSPLRRWVPFLERVISDNDQKDTAKLAAKARGELAASGQMIDQLTFSVRADSRKNPAGTFHVGDIVNVNLSGWISIPDGLHPMKLIQMSGDLDEKITLDFQEDSWD